MQTINIYSKSRHWLGRVLSNLAYTPFRLDDQEIGSIEGFHQGIKYADANERKRVLSLSGLAARQARAAGNRQAKGWAYWRNRKIVWKSAEYDALYVRALRAKFTTHALAKFALLGTTGCHLEHRVPRGLSSDSNEFSKGLTGCTLLALRTDLAVEYAAWVGELERLLLVTSGQTKPVGSGIQQLNFKIKTAPTVSGWIRVDGNGSFIAACNCDGSVDLARSCCPHLIAALYKHDRLFFRPLMLATNCS